MDLIIVIASLIICYYTGKKFESEHYKSIKSRELMLYKSPCLSFSKEVLETDKITGVYFVSSSVVVGCDYFKSFVATLANLFGGNISAFESVFDRGRREAILRIREQAAARGAQTVINTKIETVMVDPIGTTRHPKVCITAYGTAIKYDK